MVGNTPTYFQNLEEPRKRWVWVECCLGTYTVGIQNCRTNFSWKSLKNCGERYGGLLFINILDIKLVRNVELLLLWSNATLVFVYVNLVVNEPNDSLFQERELQAANEDLRKQVYIQNIASH